MLRTALVLLGTAASVAAVDVAHKATAGGAVLHERSGFYVAGVAVGSLVWAGAIVLTRSTAIALAGGVLAGGAAGNLLSLAFWPGVPNPIELGAAAFSLADVFVLVGFALVAGATLHFAAANRSRLRDPVRMR